MLDDLPNDVLDLVFSRLSADDIARCECVSKRIREAARRAPLRIRVRPATYAAIRSWAQNRADRVTAVRSRRVPFPVMSFPNLTHVDMMFTRIGFRAAALSNLRYLRLGRLHRSYDRADVFLTSELPASLTRVYLSFDDSFRRVVVDSTAKIQVLHIDAPCNFLGRPDIFVYNLGNVTDLVLATSGRVLMFAPTSEARHVEIEGMDNVTFESMAAFAHAESIIATFPRVMCKLSDVGADSPLLALDVSFLAIDVVPKNLRRLEVRCDRLATVSVPSRVSVDVEIRGVPVDREFFK